MRNEPISTIERVLIFDFYIIFSQVKKLLLIIYVQQYIVIYGYYIWNMIIFVLTSLRFIKEI